MQTSKSTTRSALKNRALPPNHLEPLFDSQSIAPSPSPSQKRRKPSRGVGFDIALAQPETPLGIHDTLRELVLSFTDGSPFLQQQGAFAQAQAATCETDGHRVRVIVLLRELRRDIRNEEAQALQTPSLSSVAVSIKSAGSLSVLGKRSRDSNYDGEDIEKTQVVKRTRSTTQKASSKIAIEITSPAVRASKVSTRKITRRSTTKATPAIIPSSEATSSDTSTSTSTALATTRTAQPLTVARKGRPAWDKHTREVIHNAYSSSNKGSSEIRRGVNISLALHPSLKLEYDEGYNPQYGDRNSVEPDPDALSEDEEVVRKRELQELEYAVMQLKSRQRSRA